MIFATNVLPVLRLVFDSFCPVSRKLTTHKGFKAELLHANNIQAAHLNLSGCTVVDMLPR